MAASPSRSGGVAAPAAVAEAAVRHSNEELS